MSKTVIKVENISKMYDLGLVGTGTLSKDLNRTWAKLRGESDPYATLAELNDRTEISKSGTVWALKDISFEVAQGEVLGIIGKNGAGKSTLLKILSRITSPTLGDIKIKGRVASLLEVGTGMHPEMTARQNIFLNGAIMGMTRKEVTRKLDEIVDFAGIGKYLDTPIKRFSSGMQVRLGFAVAAFLEPEILIVDEVLAVGDAEFQKKAVGKMQQISKGEGRTVLFVSHNMESVRKLCSKAMIISQGICSPILDVEQAVNKYLSDESTQKKHFFKIDKNTQKKLDICYIDEAKVSPEVIRSGSDMVVEVDVFCRQKCRGDLHIGIYNYLGVKLSHVSSVFAIGETTFFDKGKRKILCNFPNLPLPPGSYFLNLSLHINGVPCHREKSALCFDIDINEYYKHGKFPSAQNALFYLNSNWSFLQ